MSQDNNTNMPTIGGIAASVLNTVLDAVARNNLDQLPVQGIDVNTARELAALPAAQFVELIRSSSTAIDVRVDVHKLRAALGDVQCKAKVTELENELLRLDASLPVMQYLFNWSNHHYTRRRQALSLRSSGGRPRIPTDKEENDIIRAWKKSESLQLIPRLIATASAAHVPLSVLWPYVLPLVSKEVKKENLNQIHLRHG